MYKKAIDFSILTFLNLATSWMPTTSDNFPTAFGWYFFFLSLTINLSSHMSFLVFVLLHFGHDQVSLTVNTEANPLFILNILWILYELIFACATLIDIHRECKYHSSSGEKPTSASVFTYTITQDVWLTSQGSFLTTSKFWLPSFTHNVLSLTYLIIILSCQVPWIHHNYRAPLPQFSRLRTFWEKELT